MKNVKPLDDKVLVKVIETEQEKTSGGIILPETAQNEKPILGQVKAVGDSEMIKVKAGDNVLFNKFSGNEFQINRENYIILPAADILAVVEL